MLTDREYLLQPTLKDLGLLEVVEPKYGDYTLNLHPACLDLPPQFSIWKEQIESIIERVPDFYKFQNFITINSKFFTQDSALRREGVHIDGNFCADPNFSCSTWGGTTTTWGGTSLDPQLNIVTKWVSPYGVTPPLGTYVTPDFGGILIASSFEGCDVFEKERLCYIDDEGSLEHEDFQEPTRLEANKLYFMSSDTPHSSLVIPRGNRRTLIRITLDHSYDTWNKEIA
jgi:hypothetical protein